VTFEFWRLRFRFHAEQSLYFPPGKAANTLRGAFGMMLRETASPAEYARIFAPVASGAGPSGLADRPRPFVFRAAHLDGKTIPAGASFRFDMHLFDVNHPVSPALQEAYARLTEAGLGAGRSRAMLVAVDQEHFAIPLDGPREPAARVRVTFLTPTELKSRDRQKVAKNRLAGESACPTYLESRPQRGGTGAFACQPEFPILFARLRDRISTLRALYGPGPLDIDFRAMGERASLVRLTRCDLRWIEVERRSSRTGQAHPLGGFTGEVEYDGDLGEFLPYLRAGQWTGVGRQTVWGKGEICFQVCS
jgi:hypothetical protein